MSESRPKPIHRDARRNLQAEELLELLESDPAPNAALEAAIKHHHDLIVRQKPGKTEESHHAT